MNDVRLSKNVTQKTETGHLHGEPKGLRRNLQDPDLQNVPRLRAVHVDRPGEWMNDVEVASANLLRRGGFVDLKIESIECFDPNHLARIDARDRRNVGMPPVVPSVRLGTQRLQAVDFDVVVGLEGHGRASAAPEVGAH